MEEKVIVRQAMVSELEDVREFLWPEWKLSKEYYEQYHMAFDRFWFVIGRGEISNSIYGACGLVMTTENDMKDAQVTLLYADKSNENFSSASLLNYIQEKMGFRSVSTCGVRKNVVVLYKWLGFMTGKMQHFYKLGYCNQFKIAEVKNVVRRDYVDGENYLERVTNAEQLKEFGFSRYEANYPYKDFWCVKHRYFDEKKHKYDVYKVINGTGEWNSIIVMREIEAFGSKWCKIVDFIGQDEDVAQLGKALDELVREREYEYLDFYNVGIDKELLGNAGFVEHTKDDENIIPHYSEPVIKSNRDIYYITDNSKVHLYVGDADQDRSVYGYMEE